MRFLNVEQVVFAAGSLLLKTHLDLHLFRWMKLRPHRNTDLHKVHHMARNEYSVFSFCALFTDAVQLPINHGDYLCPFDEMMKLRQQFSDFGVS